MPGVLYIVSTPIGNLEDITLRALRVLREVDCIAAEDTRHTRKLLSHYGIEAKLISYWGGREKGRAEKVMALLERNRDVALVSDAGTPGISDPGGVLVRRAIDAGVDVVSVPGPSAFLSALTVSGISTEGFVFLGFIPSRRHARRRFFDDISREQRTVVLYESPHRIIESLHDLSDVMPSRKVALCHELTKMNESVYRGTVEEVLSALSGDTVAGEYVLVVSGAEMAQVDIDEALGEVERLMRSGRGRKEAARSVAGEYGISAKTLYDESLRRCRS